MNNISIQYIIVFPKNAKKWKYYINNNMKDAHTARKDELMQFINSLIKPPATTISNEYISKFFKFIVDVPNNKVIRLKYDTQKQIEKMREKFRQDNFDGNKILQKIKKEQNKDKIELYDKHMENMVEKYM